MKLLRPGFIIALMYSFPLWGQVIYLSPSGSDLATGTSQQPLQTMQQAIDKAVHLNQQSGQDVKIILKKGWRIILIFELPYSKCWQQKLT